MKKKEKTKHKKGKKTTITILSIIILAALSIGVFYGTYYFMISKSTSSYEVSMNQYIKDIMEENKKVSAYSKNGTIDTNNSANIIKSLNDNASQLSSLKTSIESEVPTEKYRISHNNLVEGLNNNILMYKQIIPMMQNPGSKDIDNSLTSLQNYKEEAIKNYELFSMKDLKISLPKETETFLVNITNYLTELSRINKDLEIQYAQNLEFAQQLDTVTAKFVQLKTDFSLPLQRVRTGNGTYDDVLSTIEEHRNIYLSLKKDFTAITIPPKAIKIHNSFSSILDDYNIYIQELRFAVFNEKAKSNASILDEETLKSLYSSSNAKYLTLDNSYTNFFKTYTEFKTDNIK